MTIERKNSPSVPKGVLYDDCPFVGSPAIGLCIRHSAVSDAVDWLSETGCTFSPVFAGMKSTKAVSIPSIISPSQRYLAVRSIQWKVKNVYEAARCAGLPDRIAKKRLS
jgi:hypothetical protein